MGSGDTRQDSGWVTGSEAVAGPEGSERGKRARGRRKTKHKEQQGQHREVWLHNSSGRAQLMAAVKQARDEGLGMPIALINQEHHCGSAEWPDLQAMIGREGLKCMGAHAVAKGPRERSAGVGIITPRHVACGVNESVLAGSTPEWAAGRITKLWAQELEPCG